MMTSATANDLPRPLSGRDRRLWSSLILGAFRIAAYAEGALLPAILTVAVVHWSTNAGGTVVAVVGALHGTVFTAYVLLVPCVAWVRRWSLRTTSVALSVAFVPFAPWSFERRVHAGSEQLESRGTAPE